MTIAPSKDAASDPPKILGILNITSDSFSDGGLYLDPERALARARELLSDGADILDIGPASSHPDSAPVAPEEEIRRITPLLDALSDRLGLVSIDSYQPDTQRCAMNRGVGFLNDIQGFPHVDLHDELADFSRRAGIGPSRSGGGLILMHSVQASGPATREDTRPDDVLDRVREFFNARLETLIGAGVVRERIVLDPGMGFFLGTDPEVSLRVLRNLAVLKSEFGLPVLVSVSRKSFLGALTDRPPAKRGPATLAAEIFAAEHGADFIRTHDTAALSDALKIRRALR